MLQSFKIMRRSADFLLKTGVIFILLGCTGSVYTQTSQMDVLIRGAFVFDGESSDSVRTDVGIRGEQIFYLGNSEADGVTGRQEIDADGMYLTPGFIDPHTHYDKWLNHEDSTERTNLPCLAQGVTTVFLGADGNGSYKIKETMDGYEKAGIGTNVGLWIGLESVRTAVLGYADKTPDKEELSRETEYVNQGMQEGALGLSTGLYYAPQSYASTEEVVALSKAAARYDGIYDTHMRSESNKLIEAVQETLDIGEKAGIRLHISHIKCLGPAAWGNSRAIVAMVEEAQQTGQTVKACQYPYLASRTSLAAMLIPRWAQSGGKSEMVRRFDHPDTLQLIVEEMAINLALRGGDHRILLFVREGMGIQGKTLHEIAAERNLGPEKTAIELLKEDPGLGGISFSMTEDDVEEFMVQPWVMTCSDGGGEHPRVFGSFAHKIREYVLERNLLSMADFVNRSSGETARYFGLDRRGMIKEGYYADVALFDPETVGARSTYQEPSLPATGVEYVWVNGVLSFENGKPTGALAGKPLKKSILSEK